MTGLARDGQTAAVAILSVGTGHLSLFSHFAGGASWAEFGFR
jgi:hypothetical protein